MNVRIEHKGVVFALIFIALYAPVFIQGVSQNNSSIAACERSNEAIRKPLFSFLNDAEQNRLNDAKFAYGKEKVSNLEAAAKYERQADHMVAAAEEDNVLLEPNKPYIDCNEAYPAPFPLNLFE